MCLLRAGATLVKSLVHKWFDKRNAALDTSPRSGSSCTDFSLSPLLMNLTQILESVLLHNPLKATVICVAYASFYATCFPFTLLWINVPGDRNTFLNNDLSWFFYLVKVSLTFFCTLNLKMDSRLQYSDVMRSSSVFADNII